MWGCAMEAGRNQCPNFAFALRSTIIVIDFCHEAGIAVELIDGTLSTAR